MHSLFSYVLLICLGILPSLIWLSYYLKKDSHPEPKLLILKTFLMGIMISPIALILQLLFVKLASEYAPAIAPRGSGFFLWAAFVEEVVKFLAIRFIVLYDADFDEPVDAMIYMVTAALGFAAAENILVMFQILPDGTQAALSIWTLRFVGATLLHALSSALVGYFVAMAWFYQHHSRKLIFLGIAIATLFHFTFNTFLSSTSNQTISVMYTTILLLAMGFMISALFDKLKERRVKQQPTLT